MILSVHVIRDSSPNRNGGSTRDARPKPTSGNRQLQDFCQQDTGFASDKARVAIERDEAIQGSRDQPRAAWGQAAVAITAAVTVGQNGGTDWNGWKRVVAASQPVHRG